MMKQLLRILRHEDPDRVMGERLSRMLNLAEELLVEAGKRLFEGFEGDKDAFYEKDQQINALEQEVRKSLVGRLELSTATERARFLIVVGLLKDVERIGDYSKNLREAAEMLQQRLPDNQEATRLRQIRDQVEQSLRSTRDALLNSDVPAAEVLIEKGQFVSDSCERLVLDIAGSQMPSRSAVPLALATRHYKRIQKHLMNALSTLTMPLHKVDYFS